MYAFSFIKKNVFLIAVIAISILNTIPLFHNGLIPTHDGEYHIIRFHQFYKTLTDGNVYPRWAPDLNNGFGVPLFNYVYPLPNYIASIFHLFGLSFINSFKLEMIIATILGGVFMYLWSKIFWKEWGGLLSATLFIFSPYHILDIYIRGSVGEIWALAFFPGFLWSLTKYMKGEKLYFPITAFLLACIIFSHNILGVMFTGFGLLYAFCIIKLENQSLQKLFSTGFIFITGIGLSAIFWLPALFEKKYVTGLQIYDATKNFPELYQLIFPSWGSGFIEGDLQNQLSLQIGISLLLTVLLVSIYSIWSNFARNKKLIILFFLGWFFIVFFLMTSYSKFIWNMLPLMDYFQFPWRFLSLEIIIVSFLGGSIPFLLKKRILISAFIVLTIIFTIGYTYPAYYHDREDKYYISRSNFIHGTNSPGNYFNTIWIKQIPDKTKEKIVLNGNQQITMRHSESTRYTFDVVSNKDERIMINLAYFPGWNAYNDGKRIDIENTSEGKIAINIPSGIHTIDIVFQNTWIRTISEAISLLTMVILVFLVYQPFRYVKIKK